MKYDKYDEFFLPATAIQAEGARIGLCACKVCGAAILLDPRDQINMARLHAQWHEVMDSMLTSTAAPDAPAKGDNP